MKMWSISIQRNTVISPLSRTTSGSERRSLREVREAEVRAQSFADRGHLTYFKVFGKASQLGKSKERQDR